MKFTYALKRCPWCHETPSFYMLIGSSIEIKETLLPEIRCTTSWCTVNPKCKYVPIRKNQRFNSEIFKNKIEKVVHNWNDGLKTAADQGFQLDFDAIISDLTSIHKK